MQQRQWRGREPRRTHRRRAHSAIRNRPSTRSEENPAMARSDNAPAGDSEDMRRVANDYAGRLAGLGIRLNGNESADEIVQIVEAVERFERAVAAHGGDLM